jgi:ankyrin repeat protein
VKNFLFLPLITILLTFCCIKQDQGTAAKRSLSDLFNSVKTDNRIKFIGLLDLCADIDIKNASGDTLLMNAVRYNRLEMVKLLLKKGASINIKNMQGKTALMIAEDMRNKTMIDLLKMNSLEKSPAESTDDSVLKLTEGEGKKEVLKLSEIIKLLKEKETTK